MSYEIDLFAAPTSAIIMSEADAESWLEDMQYSITSANERFAYITTDNDQPVGTIRPVYNEESEA